MTAPSTESGEVLAVSLDRAHRFSKQTAPEIRLLAGLGVEGDAHAGASVQHLSDRRRDPSRPNLRQVHLIHSELFDQVAALGYAVEPGGMGENVTTRGIDLLGLPTGTVLRLGAHAAVELTGLRNPCAQINGLAPGLMNQMVFRAADGSVVRKSGVMAIVLAEGVVRPGDTITVELPLERTPLAPV